MVDVAAVSKPHNNYQQHILFDGVDNAVVTDSYAEARAALKSARTWRPWFLSQ